jgi:UDP-N-acetylmuramoyl-L-alanyl-D-glutamate--2,6-diaminopimelate ligase
VCQEFPADLPEQVTWVRVPDSAVALGIMASAWFHHPSAELILVGVTGTNGKTTVATLLYDTFSALGYRCGLISTIRYATPAGDEPASHTTPDALRLQQLLRRMADQGCDYCFMEVSSHAVAQHRIAGVKFAGGIFTNLSHDHLDFHADFDDYLRTKQSFFTGLSKAAFALTSKDDRNGLVMVQKTRAKVFTYSTQTVADFHVKVIENTIDGMHLEIGKQSVWLRLTGGFNARNIAAVIGAATILQVDEEEVLRVISTLEPVEGRFQQYKSPQGVTAVVDYAHTPDALRNVLETIREVNPDEGRVITVVGAGGDRDPFKRPQMAAIAASLSTRVILTSDNPRTEDPMAILAEMQKGIDGPGLVNTLVIADRKEAIKTAVMLAEPGDIILIAGKGHEKYQEINGVRHPFDDYDIVTNLLES